MLFSKDFLRKTIIITFIIVPLLSSLISSIHLSSLFGLGNPLYMNVILCITFELGSASSALILYILDKMHRGMVLGVFFLISFLQILGNVYYTFDYITNNLETNSKWISTFSELFNPILDNDIYFTKLLLSVLIGMPIPLLSLFFLKALMNYFKDDDIETIDDQKMSKKK